MKAERSGEYGVRQSHGKNSFHLHHPMSRNFTMVNQTTRILVSSLIY